MLLSFIFAIQKTLQILRNIFLIAYLYIIEKKFIVNKYKKQMCYKGNKSLFFDVMENGQIFTSFSNLSFSILSRIPFQQRNGKHQNVQGGTSAKTYQFQIVRIVFVLTFFKLLINDESFGKSFSFSFFAKYFDRNFKYLF